MILNKEKVETHTMGSFIKSAFDPIYFSKKGRALLF